MININFDKPLLLLIAIPLLALVLIPFFIAIRKENKSKSAFISLAIHLVMVVLVTLVAADASIVRTMTETHVYVVADVSYSADRNLAKVDEYIKSVEKALPNNSKMGVIAFGKNSKVSTPMGEEFQGISNAGVDTSGTDIKSALEHAATLFETGVVQRIVLITDGKQTSGDNLNGVIGAVENLYEKGIYIDAIYLDDNLGEHDREIQITGVDFIASTYLNHVATADVLIQSASDKVNATVTLYRGDQVVHKQYTVLTKGYNVVNFDLPTDTTGTFDYRIEVTAEQSGNEIYDMSDKNNAYTFTQTVCGKLNVLLVTENEGDADRARELYGQDAEIDVYLNDPAVPCTVEALIKYDEIILSDVDVRNLNNFSSFIASLDTVVSSYGKSLMTFGDTKIQNQTDDVLKDLEDMLPVKLGNRDQDPKLVCIVMDTSRSMEFVQKLDTAKKAATQIVELMNDHDFLILITFSGDYTTVWPSAPIGGNRDALIELINSLKPTQGTVLGKGMQEAYNKVIGSSIEDKQVFLMSDGRTWANEEDDAVEIASKLLEIGVTTSVLNTGTKEVNGDTASGPALKLLQDIAAAGQGNYYAAMDPDELGEIMLTDIADDLTESVIEKETHLNVKLKADKVLSGITTALPTINGYVYARAKASATTVLTADYVKNSGAVIETPVYAYWDYGNGKVATFTSSLSGAWVSNWQEGVGEQVFRNILLDTNVPKSKIDYPFTITLEHIGSKTQITVFPETLYYDAVVLAELTMPDGTVVQQEMLFNSQCYIYEFPSEQIGKYSVKISYSYSTRSYETSTYFDIPYADEYDSFTVFDVSDIHKIIRTRGNVFTNNEIELKNNEKDVATYTYYLALPCMVTAIALYLADIVIRKLSWVDIRNLFGLKEKKQQKKKD